MPPVRRPIQPKGPHKSTQQPTPSTQQHAPGSIFAPANRPTSAGNPNVPGHQGNANNGNSGNGNGQGSGK